MRNARVRNVLRRIWRMTPAVIPIVALAASCSITDPSGRSAEAVDLARNRLRWKSAQLRDYEFDYQLLCFCTQEATEPVHITVQSDAIVSVVRTRDGMPAVNKYGGWPRVDELFADVERRLDQNIARLDVTYDPTYGYPRSIVIDVALMAADDESQQTASNLRALR